MLDGPHGRYVWDVRVWENLGWHIAWVNGAVSLHYDEYNRSDNRRFWAMVGDVRSMTGNAELTPRTCRRFVSPVAAVRAACDYAIDRIEEYWRPIESSVRDVRGRMVR